MRDLAPDIVRQRLLIEGLYRTDIDRDAVERYLLALADRLALMGYSRPIVHAPGAAGKPQNEGFDAFLPLVDSGISLYVWSRRRFFAVVLFTCKRFAEEDALAFTREFFAAGEIQSASF